MFYNTHLKAKQKQIINRICTADAGFTSSLQEYTELKSFLQEISDE